MSIATRLRTALEQRNKGVRAFQREMEALGVEGSSYPAINRALQGKVIPSVPFLESAADLLKVERAWLITGEGPRDMDHPVGTEPVKLKDFHAGAFPWREQHEWSLLVAALELPATVQSHVNDLPLVLPNMMADLDIGNVMTLSGTRVYRPAPEYRDAIRLHYVGWYRFFTQWIEEEGAPKVREALIAHDDAIAHRFARLPAAAASSSPSEAQAATAATPRRRAPGSASKR